MADKFIYPLLIALLAGALLSTGSCRSPQKNNADGSEPNYQPAYATGFLLEKKDNDKLLRMYNPWQGAKNIELTYQLFPRDDTSAAPRPMNHIPIPVQRAVCLSTTHIAFIDAVGETGTIVGVSGIGYVSNPTVQAHFAQGKVRDVGFETLLSYETIAALQPDVVFAYGVYGEMAGVTAKLNEMGIRVVYLADYLEENLLGKAEYMVAVSAFFNKEQEAIARFNKISADYEAMAETVAAAVTSRPAILFNAPWRDTWYMPGEKNYMNKLVHDAGAQTVGVRSGRNSSPVSLETAYTYALKADYWFHPNFIRSLEELKATDSRFANVPAFVNQKVYNNTRRVTPNGGSDFWESGAIRPDIILKDLVYIVHPDILPGHELVYYEKLQ